eukprot:COSAG06_NODE_3430_length_5356_cov_9.963287_1_plen_99_part_00
MFLDADLDWEKYAAKIKQMTSQPLNAMSLLQYRAGSAAAGGGGGQQAAGGATAEGTLAQQQQRCVPYAQRNNHARRLVLTLRAVHQSVRGSDLSAYYR